jgi:hypothetical protein
MKNLGALNYAAALNSAARRSKLPGEQIAGAECREQVDAPADVEVFSLDIPFYRTFLFIGRPIIHVCPYQGRRLSTLVHRIKLQLTFSAALRSTSTFPNMVQS